MIYCCCRAKLLHTCTTAAVTMNPAITTTTCTAVDVTINANITIATQSKLKPDPSNERYQAIVLPRVESTLEVEVIFRK